MELTGYQIKTLYEFLGGDHDTTVTVQQLPERTTDPGTGKAPTTLKAGLYAWITDYPDEGALLLHETESAARAAGETKNG